MRRYKYILLTVSTFITGIIIVKFFHDFPVIRGFGGDFLVVIFLYALVKSFKPKMKALTTAFGVFIFSVMIETLQYFKLVELLEIKNRIARIIIGSTFDFYDILAYFMGLICIMTIDLYKTRRSQSI